MKIRIYQVDAFTSRVFGGNPAAVCRLDEWLEDDILQSIANENNLSETAFFVGSGSHYSIRWFTPTSEVDLCGHATLASGYVISRILGEGSHSIHFSSATGDLTVLCGGERLCLDFPSRPGKEVECPEMLREVLGIEPIETLLSRDYLAILESEESVRTVSPNLNLLKKLEASGVLISAPGNECDFVSRCFFPRFGVPEDPVTGSAHCTLIPYWANRLNKNELYCRQISARGGDLWCELRGDRVYIGGDCILYLTGEILLPDKR